MFLEGLQANNMGYGSTGRCGTFSPSPQGIHVVGGVMNGGFPDILTLGQEIMGAHDGCELQVTICDGTRRVGEHHELGLCAEGK
jgi:hypothetical protein